MLWRGIPYVNPAAGGEGYEGSADQNFGTPVIPDIIVAPLLVATLTSPG